MKTATVSCTGCKGTGKECDHVMETCRDCNGTTMFQGTGPCRHCSGTGKHRTKITKKLVNCDPDRGGCGGSGVLPRGKARLCNCVSQAGPSGKRWSRVNFRTCTQCGGNGKYTPGHMSLDNVLPAEALQALEAIV